MPLTAVAMDDTGQVVAAQAGRAVSIAEWMHWCDRMQREGFAVGLVAGSPVSGEDMTGVELVRPLLPLRQRQASGGGRGATERHGL